MIVAQWKPNIPYKYTADAQTVAEEILSIGESATAEQIVDKARDNSTELHKCFEWDDSVAAEKYRCVQARTICTNLVIKKTEDQPQDAPNVRVFYMTKKEEGFKSSELIFHKEDEYAALLARAMSELRAFKAKYSMLQELEEILALID